MVWVLVQIFNLNVVIIFIIIVLNKKLIKNGQVSIYNFQRNFIEISIASRITFGFLECALCKKYMNHPSLKEDIDPIMKLHDEIKVTPNNRYYVTNNSKNKSLERLKLLNLLQCEEISKKESKFYNDPMAYGMHRFSYFPCYRCKVNPFVTIKSLILVTIETILWRREGM